MAVSWAAEQDRQGDIFPCSFGFVQNMLGSDASNKPGYDPRFRFSLRGNELAAPNHRAAQY
jgi:hypothetical protein